MRSTSSRPAPAHRLGVAVNCLVWFATCALFGSAINRLLPMADVGGVKEKYEYFAARRDQYSLLFVGSSRVYHEIIPARLDAGVAAVGGGLVRSFNFGVDGMRPPETFYVLRRLLALRPSRLRWVVVEMMEIDAGTSRRNARTSRLAYWHDWRHTRLAWQDVKRARGSAWEKSMLMVAHGMHFIRQSLNVGRGVEWTGEHLSRMRQRPARKGRVEMEGFEPLLHREMSPTDLAAYQSAVKQLAAGIKSGVLDPLLWQALHPVVADIRAASAEPIFIIPPTLRMPERFAHIPGGATLFAFNDPTAFPNLFDPAIRFDSEHLDETGAKFFSDILAKHIGAHLARRP